MITAIHRFGQGNCGRIAFYYDEQGAPIDRIDAERVTMPDGSHPTPDSVMVCGSCGAEISPQVLDALPGELQDVRAK